MFLLKEKMASDTEKKYQDEIAVLVKQHEEEKTAKQKLIKEQLSKGITKKVKEFDFHKEILESKSGKSGFKFNFDH